MQQYLRIVNPGVCPTEAFTTLGVSTSSGHKDLIGQFGSGAKHATNVCLRAGINPMVYCGLTRVQFHTQPEEIGGKQFSRVYVKVSNRNARPMDMVVEYGSHDWDNLHMALREYVSNAIDAAGGTTKGVKIDVVDKVTGRQDKTIIAIPLTPEVQRWYQGIGTWFLHFSDDKTKLKKKVLPRGNAKGGFLYRKGVLVHTTGNESSPALFDYNFGDELVIDEARNLDKHRVMTTVADVLGTSGEHLTEVFRRLPEQDNFWERSLPEWHLQNAAGYNQETWVKAWKRAYGNAIIDPFGCGPMTEMAQRKGHVVVGITNANWFQALERAGVKTTASVLVDVDRKGRKFYPPTDETQAILDQVWEWFVVTDLDNGKDKPQLKLFEKVMEGGTLQCGFYSNGVIHIHLEHVHNHQTYVEEVAHYVTGSIDCTRDFQDFAFKLATKCALGTGL